MNPQDQQPIATPRTDSAVHTRSGWVKNIVTADFARTLERELVQKEQLLERQVEHQISLETQVFDKHNEVAELEKERDKLRKAVQLLIDEVGAPHESGCPEDDTCKCDLVAKLNDALNLSKSTTQ